MLAAHQQAPIPPLHGARSDVPVALERVVQRALAKDPSRRFATAADMRAALQGAVAQPGDAGSMLGADSTVGDDLGPTAVLPVTSPVTVQPPSPGRGPSTPPASTRIAPRRWWARPATLVGLVLAIGAFLALLVSANDQPTLTASTV